MLLFLKNLLFTVLVPGAVAVFIPYRIVARGSQGPVFEIPQLVWSTPFFLLGAGVYFWCLWDFAVTGRGTPAPIDPPKQLIVRGLYRRARNPIYIGVLLVVAAWALLFRSVAVLEYGIALALAFHLFVLLVEEPQLRRRFGASYETYCRKVPRWLPRWSDGQAA